MSAHYELRIDGHLDDHWTRWFDDLTVVREDNGTTALQGLMTDQAELHGVLVKVRDLGLILISVNPTETSSRLHWPTIAGLGCGR